LPVNATQVPTNPDIALFTLIGTWALVVVAVITVAITAWQTRKGQKISSDQVQESVAQTDLQREQIARLIDEQERPRIRELIKRVLTPLIENIEYNNQVRMRSYLEEEVLLHDQILTGGASSDPVRLTYDSFKSEYPEMEKKIKAYDEQIIDLRKMRTKLQELLVSRVSDVSPSLLRTSSSIPKEWNIGQVGSPRVSAEQIVRLGIFLTLREKPVEIKGLEGFLWAEKSKELMALTEEDEPKKQIGEMKKLAQKCYDDGAALIQELSKLRDGLGSRYKITREDYFIGNPFDR
jgi:hypothetical protein